MSMTHVLWSQTKGFQSYGPFFKIHTYPHRESFLWKFSHIFQVNENCHPQHPWRVDANDKKRLRPSPVVPEVCFLHIHKEFSSHSNETCYFQSLWRIDVHQLLLWGLTGSKGTPLFQIYYTYNVYSCREGATNYLNSFEVILTIVYMVLLVWIGGHTNQNEW